jgi:cyclohexyl-isocyanide hydratase
MTQEKPMFNIAIPVYEMVDLMDVAAPYEIFNWMGVYWNEGRVKVQLVATALNSIKTLDGFKITPDVTFNDCYEQSIQFELLWVPGGTTQALQKMMRDKSFLDFIRQQSERADYVTSVCNGAILLASAGLLDGYTATTHWAYIPFLREFPGVKIAEGHPRYVIDGNRVTGGGISSGLDESLELVARISNYEVAKQVQLVTQYFPDPPVCGEIPGSDTRPMEVNVRNSAAPNAPHQ